ncbi:MAG: hypothetical protein CMO01_32005 [Thalassobius sp.]|nr:hypothetical protein [Thalassovita sp.]
MNSFKRNWILMLLIGLTSFVISCDEDDYNDDDDIYPEDYTVQLASTSEFGNILTDKEGNSLYFFGRDVEGISNCSGGCLNNWTVFFEEEIKVSEGLSKSDFGTITNEDGGKQTTYKGWPLYFFNNDEKPGDINGDKVLNLFYVAKPDYTLMIGGKEISEDINIYLVDQTGNTLYNSSNDEEDISNCSGGCLDVWPPFTEEIKYLPSILVASDFGKVEGSDQNTYKGKPMYFFVNDENRGDTNGHDVNGFLVFGNSDISEEL